MTLASGERLAYDRLVVATRSRMRPPRPTSSLPAMPGRADTGHGHWTLQSCQHVGLLGLPMAAYAQLRYVTCLDLGRSGAVITDGWAP